MRFENFNQNEYYHISNRGVGKEKIFLDDLDMVRFIFLMTHFQSPTRLYNVSWYTKSYIKNGKFSTGESKISDVLKDRSVELIAFSILPGEFHLSIKNLEEKILSVYMHRILTAYGKYFNTKYKRKGHVFEGPFSAAHIKNNTELIDVSAYIHRKPSEMSGWKNTYEKYLYSSYQDYIGLNRWGSLLSTHLVLNQFRDQSKYRDFVTSSKDLEFK